MGRAWQRAGADGLAVAVVTRLRLWHCVQTDAQSVHRGPRLPSVDRGPPTPGSCATSFPGVTLDAKEELNWGRL